MGPLVAQGVDRAVEEAVVRAVRAALGVAVEDAQVRPSAKADFQTAVAMKLAYRVGRPAREVAAEVAAALDDDVIGAAEDSGPGFVNITVSARP